MTVPVCMTAQHIQALKRDVQEYLDNNRESVPSFSRLNAYINERWRQADKEMFKEWLQANFPNARINYAA